MMYFFYFLVFVIIVVISIPFYADLIEFKRFEKTMIAKQKAQDDRIARKIAEAMVEEAKTNGRLKELIEKIKNQQK